MYFPFVDVNECSSGLHDCHSNATCEDVAGSFECYCNDGFTGNGTLCTGLLYLHFQHFTLINPSISQISMNVKRMTPCVIPMLIVLILLEVTNATVQLDSLEMAAHVQVCI